MGRRIVFAHPAKNKKLTQTILGILGLFIQFFQALVHKAYVHFLFFLHGLLRLDYMVRLAVPHQIKKDR